jgi:hypothetical protein
MQMGEKIMTSNLKEDADLECPFYDDIQGVSQDEEEGIGNDDQDNVQELQDNNGGILGDNLNAGSNGEDATWKGAPYEPPAAKESKASDSKRKEGKKGTGYWQKVKVPGTDDIDSDSPGLYPFTVAAHHLIPGNASLYNEGNNLKNYMIQGETIKAGGKSWTIKYHIGYNVNGAHNGVWLPGNYAIRTKTSPTKVTWGKMGHEDWQLNYVAACVKATGGQFHDAHAQYNEAVRKLMNKAAVKLKLHQANCPKCKDKQGQEIPPPYLIKQRLYKLSNYLRTQLTLPPEQWRRPWFTSDRWRDVVFENNAEHPCEAFLEAYKSTIVETMEEN